MTSSCLGSSNRPVYHIYHSTITNWTISKLLRIFWSPCGMLKKICKSKDIDQNVLFWCYQTMFSIVHQNSEHVIFFEISLKLATHTFLMSHASVIVARGRYAIEVEYHFKTWPLIWCTYISETFVIVIKVFVKWVFFSNIVWFYISREIRNVITISAPEDWSRMCHLRIYQNAK